MVCDLPSRTLRLSDISEATYAFKVDDMDIHDKDRSSDESAMGWRCSFLICNRSPLCGRRISLSTELENADSISAFSERQCSRGFSFPLDFVIYHPKQINPHLIPLFLIHAAFKLISMSFRFRISSTRYYIH